MHRARQATATIVLTPGGEPRRVRAGGNGRRRQHPAVHREAGPGADHDQPDQRRHLRAGTVHLRPHPRRRAVVDRAQGTSRRSSSAARPSWPTCTRGTGSTSARRTSTRRCTATSWRAVFTPRRSPDLRPPEQRWRETRWSGAGATIEGPVFHRRGRHHRGRRPRGPAQRGRAGLPGRRGSGGGRLHPVERLCGRRQRDPAGRHRSARRAGLASRPPWAPRCSATAPT